MASVAPMPRSIFRAAAIGTKSATHCVTKAVRSSICGGALGADSSERASRSNCCTNAEARRMPSPSSSARPASPSGARARKLSIWICRAASGVRSSCAASATNRFCCSSACWSRSVSVFMAMINGAISVGTPATGICSRLSTPRSPTIFASWVTRPSRCPSNQPITAQASGMTTRMGTPACKPAVSAISWRTLMRCAT